MDFSSLNNFDYLILAITAISTILALFKGFIASFLSFFGWIVAAILALNFYPQASDILAPHIKHKMFLMLCSTIGLYLVLLILISIVNGRILSAASNLTGGAVDRSLGIAFGFVRGCLISCGIFFFTDMVLQSFEEKMEPSWLHKAQTYHLLTLGTNYLSEAISAEDTKEQLMKYFNIEEKKPLLESLSKSTDDKKQLDSDKEPVKIDEIQIEEHSLETNE